MRPEDERSFGADDPVARYWLHHCVGFHVRGVGVVDGIATDDGVTKLEVRRLGGRGWTTHIPTDRVESIDPWTETIALAAQRRPPREKPHIATRAAASVAVSTAAIARTLFALLSRLLLAAAALARKHAPGARERVGAMAATLAAVGQAYALEAKRAYKAQAAAMNTWRDERRRGEWGDESAPTRAGDDETDARHVEEDRAWPSRRVGR